MREANGQALSYRVVGIIIVDLPTGFNHEQKNSNANPGYHCEPDKKYFHDVAPQVPSREDVELSQTHNHLAYADNAGADEGSSSLAGLTPLSVLSALALGTTDDGS